MARSLWTGSLSFGLVNVPVQLVSAVRDMDLHFRQLHEKDKSPIETQRWCSEEDKEVPFEAVTRSYELEGGKTVIVTDEDLEAVEPRRTRTIDIEQFVVVSGYQQISRCQLFGSLDALQCVRNFMTVTVVAHETWPPYPPGCCGLRSARTITCPTAEGGQRGKERRGRRHSNSVRASSWKSLCAWNPF